MSQSIVVLVVDDEESLCDLMAELLSDRYMVYKAFNGKQALELVQQHKPALVISDIMMPHMTGIELLQRLRAAEETRSIPVILLSAAHVPSAELTQEVAAFVSKPFEIDKLESLVENALARYRKTGPLRQLNESGQMQTRSQMPSGPAPSFFYSRSRSTANSSADGGSDRPQAQSPSEDWQD